MQGRENLGFTNLPPVCIYNLDEQVYSNLYEVDVACPCGTCEWYVSSLEVNISNVQAPMTPKRIQRCVRCNEIRLSRLNKKIVEKQMLSKMFLNKISDVLNKQELGNEDVLSILENMYVTFGITTYGERKFKDKLLEINEIYYV